MLVGGYSLDLYCDLGGHPCNEGTAQVVGDTFAECVREARKAGWTIRRDDTSPCGYHVRCPLHRRLPST